MRILCVPQGRTGICCHGTQESVHKASACYTPFVDLLQTHLYWKFLTNSHQPLLFISIRHLVCGGWVGV